MSNPVAVIRQTTDAAPTVSPSILVKGGRQGSDHVCHSYLEGGRWRYLDDSTHTPSAGVTDVPMVPLPDWLVRP